MHEAIRDLFNNEIVLYCLRSTRVSHPALAVAFTHVHLP